ncbi:hypothetical protein TELCIR_11464 [Teladorsagia circumcincta]|uniref:Uncharacterized protein n=1 Tax=Teladorsagia circumcincta TaxID=45464 RepID=A0A2G9U9C4_TELCI|nr:hypothetical protein TELCIR_11464 [Teladorsagia circumcincta]
MPIHCTTRAAVNNVASTKTSPARRIQLNEDHIITTGELRCTCPHPPAESIQSHGRANLVLSRPVPHLSQSTSIQPRIRDYPIVPSPAYSHSTHHYSQYFPAHNFHRFRFGYFGQMTDQFSRCCPSAAPSLISQPCYNPPQFHYAQAEYLSLERAFAYPVSYADWVLPSSYPYYSVVFLRTRMDEHSVHDIMGRSTDDVCSSACPTCCHDRSKQPCGSCAPSQLLLNTESIRISEAYPDARGTSLSESLTLENDVYESDSEEDSEKPRPVRAATPPSVLAVTYLTAVFPKAQLQGLFVNVLVFLLLQLITVLGSNQSPREILVSLLAYFDNGSISWKPVEYHDVSEATMTALPIYDPKCYRCSEARFADRLCETLDNE